jgi:hypothetical protein
MKPSSLRHLIFSSALLFAVSASATDQVVEKPVTADTPEKFAQTIAALNHEMDTGGRYEFISPDQRGKVEADLNSMASMLQKAGSVDAMPERDKVHLFNTQEHVNGLLVHNDSNRLICEHRAPLGSTIPITMCRTVGEIAHSRKAGQKMIFDAGTVGSTCLGQRSCRSN